MPKSKEILSDTGSDSNSESEEEVKSKSKAKKPEKKKEKSSESENSESEEDTKSKKRPKKSNDKGSNKKAKKESKNGDPTWDLGGKKFVTVRTFRGELYVDIREMYMDKDGEMKPGKKGICLNTKTWKELLKVVKEVDECVQSKC